MRPIIEPKLVVGQEYNLIVRDSHRPSGVRCEDFTYVGSFQEDHSDGIKYHLLLKKISESDIVRVAIEGDIKLLFGTMVFPALDGLHFVPEFRSGSSQYKKLWEKIK